ncbi:unnamed protein product [Lupinus luteus]|uniref:DET1- and DDB1-associated protein 1 domain-containing protein n=1 Tax=Lupinus luteus TaxID=3873 RepID=A0AAV1Y7X7_LUPLU
MKNVHDMIQSKIAYDDGQRKSPEYSTVHSPSYINSEQWKLRCWRHKHGRAIAEGGMRVYTCVRDTSPPEGQHIKTNQQNILIRSLTLKKQKDASESSRKRPAEKAAESRAPAKRTNNQINSLQEGSNSQTSHRDFQNLTVERLRALLKAQAVTAIVLAYIWYGALFCGPVIEMDQQGARS